ncbi:unnamed protein product [Schistosoma margrebowiei]|uniref:Uncharacterized protein n=1 Tax=Schistosoma margrebowiei TaxID=48269 RepID=A0A183ML93_9TREM|nr:unnamed protein product [Schistosoma margrebowiei]
MVVGGSQQETPDPGFVLLGTRQQGVPPPSDQSIVITSQSYRSNPDTRNAIQIRFSTIINDYINNTLLILLKDNIIKRLSNVYIIMII